MTPDHAHLTKVDISPEGAFVTSCRCGWTDPRPRQSWSAADTQARLHVRSVLDSWEAPTTS